ncbi:MAG: ATP-binding protein [Phycisphaerales bacterium]
MNTASSIAARWTVAAALAGGALASGFLPMPGWAGTAIGLMFGAAALRVLLGSREDPHRAELQRLASRVVDVARVEPDDPRAPMLRAAREALDDIESRLGAASNLEASHRDRLQSLLDAVDAPIIATDDRGFVTYCNRAAQSLVGTRADLLTGRPIDQAFTQADLLRLHAAARAGRAGRERVRIARSDGVSVFDAAAVPIREGPDATPEGAEDPAAGPSGSSVTRAVVMTLRDVTELSRSVQVKSDFVANASHELRTPIAALRIAVETLQGGAMDDAAMRPRLLGMIEGNTARLEEMVRDLLDLSRLESPEARVRVGPFPASELRDTLAPMFERVCRERRLTLTFDLHPALEALRTDRDLLTLVLKNLVENATKFADEDTEVRLVGRPVAPEPGGEPLRDPDGAAPGGGARFDVIDRGVGIPLSQQQRIFERYYQVDPSRSGFSPRRGSGLGLAIVKHAVKTLGGSIRVHSVWKQGTTMTVELPGVLPASDPG